MQLQTRPASVPAGQAPSGEPPFADYHPATRAGLDPALEGEFAQRIAAFRSAYIALGQPLRSALQVLDLDQIRLRFGRRWPEVRAKVIGIAEAVIQRDFGPDELYVAARETLFYLLRLGEQRRDLEHRGGLLAAEITERLCGTIPGGVAVRLRTLPLNYAQALAGVVSLAQLRNRVEALGEALDDAELRLFLDHAERIEPWFRPTLHLRKGLVSAYQLAPFVVRDEGEPMPLEDLCPRGAGGVFHAESDCWAIQHAGSVLLDEGARRPLLIVPLQYDTLANPRLCQQLLVFCRQLPPLAGRRLVVELLGLPPSLTQARVTELLDIVRPFCRCVIVRLPEDAVYVEHLAGTGVRGLSLSLGLDPGSEAARQTVAMLVDAARSQGLRSLLVAAGSVGLCEHAMRLGVDQLNGDALLPRATRFGRALLTRGR